MTLKSSYWFLFLLAILLPGCSSPTQSVSSGQGTAIPTGSPTGTLATIAPTSKISWLVSATALASLQTTGTGWSEEDSAHFFDAAHTYVIGQIPGGWNSTSTRTFTSYAALKTAFTSKTLPSSVGAIVYDNEAWQFTPVEEQQNFALYVKEAAELVHHHHMLLIAAPATDLVSVLTANGQGSSYSRFLSLGLIRDAARYADVIDIQAQGSESSISTYAPFVRAAAVQAKAVHPHVVILAGLSTNPDGKKMTGQQLYAAFQATSSDVSGYWLNIPSNQGGYCPRCGTPQPQVAVAFLKMLG